MAHCRASRFIGEMEVRVSRSETIDKGVGRLGRKARKALFTRSGSQGCGHGSMGDHKEQAPGRRFFKAFEHCVQAVGIQIVGGINDNDSPQP